MLGLTGCAGIRNHFSTGEEILNRQYTTVLKVTCAQPGAKFRICSDIPDVPDSKWMDIPGTLNWNLFEKQGYVPGTDLYHGRAWLMIGHAAGYIPRKREISVPVGQIQKIHINLKPWPWSNMAVPPFMNTDPYTSARMADETVAELARIGCGIDLVNRTQMLQQLGLETWENGTFSSIETVLDIGRCLGADAMLIGSLKGGLSLKIVETHSGRTVAAIHEDRQIQNMIPDLLQSLCMSTNAAENSEPGLTNASEQNTNTHKFPITFKQIMNLLTK